MDSVILSSPLTLVLYGIALALNLFDRKFRATKGILTLVSCAVTVLTSGYALTIGAGLWECATVLLIFLLLNMEVKA